MTATITVEPDPMPVSDDAVRAGMQGFAPALPGGFHGYCRFTTTEFDAEALEACTAGGPIWSDAAWWRALEAQKELLLIYLCVHDTSGRLCAVLPCLWVRDASTMLYYNPPRTLASTGNFGAPEYLCASERVVFDQAQARLAAGSASLYPSLMGSIPNSCCALALRSDLVPAQRAFAAQAAAQLFEKVATRLGCRSRAVFYTTPEITAAFRTSTTMAGHASGGIAYDCVIDVRWLCFEAYLMHFSKKRRQSVRHERERFLNSGIHVDVVKGAAGLTDDLVRMQVELRAKYGQSVDEALIRSQHAAFRHHLDREIVVFVARRGEQCLGFTLAFQHGAALHLHLAGLDYEAIEGTYTYFNLSIYEPLEWAMRHGLSRVHVGLSSYETKIRRGCRLVPLHGFVATDGPLAQDLKTVMTGLSASEMRAVDAIPHGRPIDGNDA